MARRILQTPTGEAIEVEQQLRRGTEGEIWTVRDRPLLVAKLFYDRVLEERDGWFPSKVAAMLASPPGDPEPERTVIAWPITVLYENEHFRGYLMPREDGANTLSYAPGALLARKRDFPTLSKLDMYQTALRLAAAVEAVHRAGHLVGDFNPSNFVWRDDGALALVDTDSFHIVSQTGRIYRSEVPPAEYRPPELQGEDPRLSNWKREHDYFALAVHIFSLLFQAHPFEGVLKTGKLMEDATLQLLAEGVFPHVGSSIALPPANLRGQFRCLSAALQQAFENAFVTGKRRPSASDWALLLRNEIPQLVPCPTCGESYANSFRTCPYCRARRAESRGHLGKWLLGTGAALVFLGFAVGAGWAISHIWPGLQSRLRRPAVAAPARKGPPLPANPPNRGNLTTLPRSSTSKLLEERFPQGKQFWTQLRMQPGALTNFIRSQKQDVVELERIGAESEFRVSWPGGEARLRGTNTSGTPPTSILEERDASAMGDGWRDVKMTLGLLNEWSATYRLPWTKLGFSVAASGGLPEWEITAVARGSVAEEKGLNRNQRIAVAGGRAGAAQSGNFFDSLAEDQGEVTLLVFSGPSEKRSGFISRGEVRFEVRPGEFAILQWVGPGSRAAAAGLEAGDIVLGLGDKDTRTARSTDELRKLLDRQITFEIYRNNLVKRLTLKRDTEVQLSFPDFRER